VQETSTWLEGLAVTLGKPRLLIFVILHKFVKIAVRSLRTVV
jgi:hypothetical protein